MAKVPLDLSKFKKVSTDKGATILKHSDGHEIKLAHHALSPKMRGQLQALPMMEKAEKTEGKAKPAPKMMAEGAQPENAPNIDDILAGQNSSSMPTAPQISAAPIASEMPGEQPQGAPLDIEAITPEAPSAQGVAMPGDGMAAPAPQAVPQMAPQGPVAGPPNLQGASAPLETPTAENAYRNAMEAAHGQAAAETRIAEADMEARNKEAANLAQIQSNYTNKLGEIDGEVKGLMQAIQDQHIDPNHYMGSLDTGQKIGVAIGLIAGGMGGAHAQGNPALDYINKQIANDIDAQKAELGKKHTLLSAALQKYGNLRDATQMATIFMQAATANQLQRAALSQSNQMAASRLLATKGELENRYVPVMQQQALQQMLAQHGPMGQDPEKYINLMNLPESEKAAALKEAGEMKQMVKFKDLSQQAFESIAKAVDDPSLGPIERQRVIDAYLNPVVAQMSKELAGKFTENDQKAFLDLFPNRHWYSKSDTDRTIDVKRQQLEKFVTQKMEAPHLVALNLDPQKFMSTNPNAAYSMRQSGGGSAQGAVAPQASKVDLAPMLAYAKQYPNAPVSINFFAKHPELKGR